MWQWVSGLLSAIRVAERPYRIHRSGIWFFYERTLKRPWPVFELVRPRKRQTLAIVLSPQEVRSVLALVEGPKARMCLRRLYAGGLRWRAGTQLQVWDLDPNACWSA